MSCCISTTLFLTKPSLHFTFSLFFVFFAFSISSYSPTAVHPITWIKLEFYGADPSKKSLIVSFRSSALVPVTENGDPLPGWRLHTAHAHDAPQRGSAVKKPPKYDSSDDSKIVSGKRKRSGLNQFTKDRDDGSGYGPGPGSRSRAPNGSGKKGSRKATRKDGDSYRISESNRVMVFDLRHKFAPPNIHPNYLFNPGLEPYPDGEEEEDETSVSMNVDYTGIEDVAPDGKFQSLTEAAYASAYLPRIARQALDGHGAVITFSPRSSKDQAVVINSCAQCGDPKLRVIALPGVEGKCYNQNCVCSEVYVSPRLAPALRETREPGHVSVEEKEFREELEQFFPAREKRSTGSALAQAQAQSHTYTEGLPSTPMPDQVYYGIPTISPTSNGSSSSMELEREAARVGAQLPSVSSVPPAVFTDRNTAHTNVPFTSAASTKVSPTHTKSRTVSDLGVLSPFCVETAGVHESSGSSSSRGSSETSASRTLTPSFSTSSLSPSQMQMSSSSNSTDLVVPRPRMMVQSLAQSLAGAGGAGAAHCISPVGVPSPRTGGVGSADCSTSTGFQDSSSDDMGAKVLADACPPGQQDEQPHQAQFQSLSKVNARVLSPVAFQDDHLRMTTSGGAEEKDGRN